jgi:hypothetical protein
MSNIEKIKENLEKEENLKIAKKISSFDILLTQLNITRDDVLNLYNNSYFRDTTLSKKDVFHRVLTGTLTKEDKEFLTECGNKVNDRQKDKRTASGYAIDLIIGWLIEDAILAFILLKGIPAKLQGADNKREFLNQSELDTMPDIIISDKQIEVVCDWTDYWMRTGKGDLRDNKFNRLVKEDAFLLGLSPISGMGFLINVSEQIHGFEYISSIYGYGGKPGYTTNKMAEFMKPTINVLENLCKIFEEKVVDIL